MEGTLLRQGRRDTILANFGSRLLVSVLFIPKRFDAAILLHPRRSTDILVAHQ